MDAKIEIKNRMKTQEDEDQGKDRGLLIKIKLAASWLDCGPGQNWGRPRNENRIDIELTYIRGGRGLWLRVADIDLYNKFILQQHSEFLFI